jgi:class 3 adenylate cyclase
MEDPIKLDRTWLCSVVFVDIIQYSKQSLELQMKWKRRFNRYLSDAIKECSENERVILDTGDGAAICFLGDPETAMFCALRLISSIAEEGGKQANPLHIRAGINLGSVKIVKDINGNLNAVGDGINVGQRVMSFAGDNQILVSRSFYEVASSLSEGYAELFKFEGVHTDKHVREHTLYELHPPDSRKHSAQTTIETVPAPAVVLLTQGQIIRVGNSLAATVGPIARYLVKHACQQAGSIAELRQALLAFVPAKADSEKFLKECGDVFSTGLVAFPSAAAPPVTPRDSAEFVWNPAVLEDARKDLAVLVGPMARLLVNRAAAKTRTPTALYQMLAGEIASAKDREAFLKQSTRL